MKNLLSSSILKKSWNSLQYDPYDLCDREIREYLINTKLIDAIFFIFENILIIQL